jgi:hypothetical protein
VLRLVAFKQKKRSPLSGRGAPRAERYFLIELTAGFFFCSSFFLPWSFFCLLMFFGDLSPITASLKTNQEYNLVGGAPLTALREMLAR